jgi:uncharacterized protein
MGELEDLIVERGKDGVIIALSGGLDSSTLAALCKKLLGDKAIAVTVASELQPEEEIEGARRVAEEIGIRHILIEMSLLKEEVARNGPDRCYHCKKAMFRRIRELAEELGVREIFDGTNASDSGRPGIGALRELGIRSPWAELGFRKEEIREIARNLGLSVSEKAPQSCLATRIPFGERITEERLMRIWRAEKLIRELTGVKILRVRDHGGIARIEVGRDELASILDSPKIDAIVRGLKGLGFRYVTLDLEGYRPADPPPP